MIELRWIKVECVSGRSPISETEEFTSDYFCGLRRVEYVLQYRNGYYNVFGETCGEWVDVPMPGSEI